MLINRILGTVALLLASAGSLSFIVGNDRGMVFCLLFACFLMLTEIAYNVAEIG